MVCSRSFYPARSQRNLQRVPRGQTLVSRLRNCACDGADVRRKPVHLAGTGGGGGTMGTAERAHGRLTTTEGDRPTMASHAARPAASDRHQVVVIGSGFGGLFGTKALAAFRRRRDHGREDDPPPLPAAALPGRDRHPLRGRDRPADPRDPGAARRTPRCCSARSPASTSRRRPSPRTCSAARPSTPYDSLIVAAGAGQSYFGNDHFAEFAPGHEDHRRRPRAARPDLRRLRDGRDRRQPGRERRPPADLRGRRRRPDRCRDGRPDRRARAPHPAPRLPGDQHPPRRGSSWSTPRRRCCRRSAPSWAPGPRRSSRSSASR